MNKLTINKRSWHYWVVDAFEEEAPGDLCGYVRRIVWNVIRLVGITIGAIFCGFLASFIIAGMPVTVYALVADAGLIFDKERLGWLAILSCVGILGWVVVGMFLYSWMRAKILVSRSHPREPSIIGQYIAARKARICPLIEFRDGES